MEIEGMTSPEEIAQLLSEGLDLCVRARKLDDAMERAMLASDAAAREGGTKCGTPALWVRDQYERDLASWEERARAGLQQSGLAVRKRP
jgi:hypothetical protein